MPLRPKVDGFMYNTSLLLLPNRFFPFALGELEVLRRANNYRARWYCVPDDMEGNPTPTTPIGTQPIAAYDTFQFQISVSPASYLWGMMFASLTGGSLATDLQLSIVDSCTGIPLFNDFASGSVASPRSTIQGVTRNSKALPVPLSKPRLILAPGLVNVEIANTTNAARQCQLVLMFAEPCHVLQDYGGCEECR